MADEAEIKRVSPHAAFLIGLVLGGGLLLVYHALDSKIINFEIMRTRQEATEVREMLRQTVNEREQLRKKSETVDEKP